MADKLTINLRSESPLAVGLNTGQTFSLQSATPLGGGTRDYTRLTNKPSLNGVTIQGSQTSADLNIVSENTEAGWAETPLYVPQAGEICLYSDTARIKIGDGTVPIVDLPYIGSTDTDAVMAALQEHTEDSSIHVSIADRMRWDAKLNYTASGENLIFTTD